MGRPNTAQTSIPNWRGEVLRVYPGRAEDPELRACMPFANTSFDHFFPWHILTFIDSQLELFPPPRPPRLPVPQTLSSPSSSYLSRSLLRIHTRSPFSAHCPTWKLNDTRKHLNSTCLVCVHLERRPIESAQPVRVPRRTPVSMGICRGVLSAVWSQACCTVKVGRQASVDRSLRTR